MNKTEIKQIIKEEAKKVIFEISTKAGLEDVAKGRTTSIEGIKVSKEMAENLMHWIRTSPYGRKYGKHILKGRIASLIGPANAMGFGDRLKGKLKGEWKAIVQKHGPKRESVTEANQFRDVSDKFKDALDNLPDKKFTMNNIKDLIKKTKQKRPDSAMAYAKDAFGWVNGGRWLKEDDSPPEDKALEEAAPRIKKDPYVEKLRLLYKEMAKLDNQMKSADSSRYSHVKRDFNKALKGVAELTNTLNRKGATIPS
jgi:hypothetical protein